MQDNKPVIFRPFSWACRCRCSRFGWPIDDVDADDDGDASSIAALLYLQYELRSWGKLAPSMNRHVVNPPPAQFWQQLTAEPFDYADLGGFCIFLSTELSDVCVMLTLKKKSLVSVYHNPKPSKADKKKENFFCLFLAHPFAVAFSSMVSTDCYAFIC